MARWLRDGRRFASPVHGETEELRDGLRRALEGNCIAIGRHHAVDLCLTAPLALELRLQLSLKRGHV